MMCCRNGTGEMSARLCAALFVIGVLNALAAYPVAADTLRVGAARIAFDATRWQVADVSKASATFVPKVTIAGRLDPVHILRHAADSDAPCERLPQDLLALHGYDAQTYNRSRVVLGGRDATRIAARTGCRNATPLGVVACVKSGGDVYVLSALQAGCHGANLFSGIDPLEEIAQGLSFAE